MTIPEGSSRVCGFIECEACRSKPGSLCEECLRRRMAFETMNESKDHWILVLVLMLCIALWVLIIIGAITVAGWLS